MSEPIEENLRLARTGVELRLPQTRSDCFDRAYVAPAERRSTGLNQAKLSRQQQDRQALYDFQRRLQRSRQAWQASAQRERDHHEASSQKAGFRCQAKFQ